MNIESKNKRIYRPSTHAEWSLACHARYATFAADFLSDTPLSEFARDCARYWAKQARESLQEYEKYKKRESNK